MDVQSAYSVGMMAKTMQMGQMGNTLIEKTMDAMQEQSPPPQQQIVQVNIQEATGEIDVMM